jgi:hypothetical protein
MTSTKPVKTDAERYGEHAFVDRESQRAELEKGLEALSKACAAMEALVMELRAEIKQEAIDRERRERELQRLRLEYHRPRPL